MSLYIRPLLIFVGSRMAGRLVHQQRLIEQTPSRFVPVKTETTRQEPKPGDDAWFRRMSKTDIFRSSFDDMLTHYEERDDHYVVLKQDARDAQAGDRTAVIGMTPNGLAHIVARQERDRQIQGFSAVDFRAIVLRPENSAEFVDMLVHERGFDPVVAEEEAERAKRLSDIPVALKSPSIFPVGIHGDKRDIGLVDDTLRAVLPP